MEGEFVQFLIKRIGKKLGDITEACSHEELTMHVDDIHEYLEQLSHLITEFIHIAI